jgi:plasmid stabilization system protein ParE
MKRRVVFAPEAQDDLLSLYTYIANQSGPSTAIGYINRIERYCLGFDLAGERGTIYARDFVSSASSAGSRSPSTSNRAPSSCRVSG